MLDELYRALEAGDLPLAVLADWYEEQGLELAPGVRWLADEGRMPGRAIDGSWAWVAKPTPGARSMWPPHCHLPRDIRDRIGATRWGRGSNGFSSVREAIESAAAAWMRTEVTA